jgi:hypothetical protein
MRRYLLVCSMIAATFVFVLFVIVYGPSSGVSNDDRSTITTERWKSTADRGSGKGVWTFSMKADGTVGVTGEWTYADSVTCPFSAGSVKISGSSFWFTVTGTATNTSAPPGYQDSLFTLEVKGELRDGKGNGTYTISFSATGWPPGISGKWTAARTEGKGITE